MKPTLSEMADNVLRFFDHLPDKPTPDEDFRSAVWSLCQKIKEQETSMDGGQLYPGSSIMG